MLPFAPVRLVAHRVISLPRSNSVAFGARRPKAPSIGFVSTLPETRGMATEGLHSAAVKFFKACGGKSFAGRGLRRPPKAASLEPQGRDVRCSIRSRRSFMGSGPHVTPELEISNRSSRTDWGRHAGMPDPFGSPYFAKLVQ